MSDAPKFYHVTELAARLASNIVVFDLETTAFRGMPNFGIMEVACFVVTPNGPGLAIQSLINPERPISPKVVELTGLTDAEVSKAELWDKRYAKLFAQISKTQWLTGFNNATFDEPAVIDMNARYGLPIEKFEKTFDVRQLHLALSNAKSKKGNLEEVAALYGVHPHGTLHRAAADVRLTLELLHAIIELYGIDAVCNYILPKAEQAVDQLTAKAIAKYVKSKKSISVEAIAEAFGKDVRTTGFEIGKAIDERLVDPTIFASQPAQAWLDSALMEVNAEFFENTRLKPLYECLAAMKPEDGLLDYVQLRVALSRAQISWSSLKAVS